MRRYQSERNYGLGRRGAYNTLVLKMAGDHINYEEDYNMRYKVPPLIVNLSMRFASFFFIVPALMLSFALGDMIKLFRQYEYFYPGKPGEEPEQIARYETLYVVDRMPRQL